MRFAQLTRLGVDLNRALPVFAMKFPAAFAARTVAGEGRSTTIGSTFEAVTIFTFALTGSGASPSGGPMRTARADASCAVVTGEGVCRLGEVTHLERDRCPSGQIEDPRPVTAGVCPRARSDEQCASEIGAGDARMSGFLGEWQIQHLRRRKRRQRQTIGGASSGGIVIRSPGAAPAGTSKETSNSPTFVAEAEAFAFTGRPPRIRANRGTRLCRRSLATGERWIGHAEPGADKRTADPSRAAAAGPTPESSAERIEGAMGVTKKRAGRLVASPRRTTT